MIAKLRLLEQVVTAQHVWRIGVSSRWFSVGNCIMLSSPSFAAFTCCQRASTPHSVAMGAIMREASIEAATTEPVVSVPSITIGAPTTITAA